MRAVPLSAGAGAPELGRHGRECARGHLLSDTFKLCSAEPRSRVVKLNGRAHTVRASAQLLTQDW